MDFNEAEERARQAGRDFEDKGKARFGKRFWVYAFAATVALAVLAQCAFGG